MRVPLSVAVPLLIVLILAAVLAVFGLPQFGPRVDNEEARGSTAAPDPRLTYSGPFENIHPSIKYVGDSKCAECHYDITLAYSFHAMGRSLTTIDELARKQPYDAAHNNPFRWKEFQLWIELKDAHVVHHQARPEVWQREQAVHFAVGSGTRGFSYFAQRDGFVFQTPISWFSQRQIWDVSPGMTVDLWPGRLVQTDCLFCHANGVKPLPNTVDRFQPGIFDGHAIGCERCHGPGEKHVAARESGAPLSQEFDPTIVNPAHLSWQLRENVCEQCHLGGTLRQPRRGRDWFDYRPGTSLSDFLLVMVKNPDLPGDHRAVGQVEQMYRSRCFNKTQGKQKLGCVSCHDPHQRVEPEDTVRHYRERCLRCHETQGCVLPKPQRLQQQADDSCIACHMPRAQTQDIAHTALSDHTIPRFSKTEPIQPDRELIPLVSFYPVDLQDEERQRDRAVALVRLVGRGKISAENHRQVLAEATRILASRLESTPDDAEGWKALGLARTFQQRVDEALLALQRAEVLRPYDDEIHQQLAALEAARGRWEASQQWWNKAAELNPYAARPRQELTNLLIRRRDWAKAEPHATQWVKLQPDSSEARHARLRILVELNRRDEAERELQVLRQLKPSHLQEIEAWWKRRTT